MGKIKCLKLECPQCHNIGLAQIFLRKDSTVKYARTRHYSHIDKESKKPQFTYCKIEDLEALKTLLSDKGISLNTEQTTAGQVGQSQGVENLDPQLGGCASVQQTRQWASSSVRIEHQPPKLGVEGSNPSPPALQIPPHFWLIFCFSYLIERMQQGLPQVLKRKLVILNVGEFMVEIKEMPYREKFETVLDDINFLKENVVPFVKEKLGDEEVEELRRSWEKESEHIPEDASDQEKYEIAYRNWLRNWESSYHLVSNKLGEKGIEEFKQASVEANIRKNSGIALSLLNFIRLVSPQKAFKTFSKTIAYKFQVFTPVSVPELTGKRAVYTIGHC
jgi:hypothetical protein